MRKVVLFIAVSVDGYIADKNGNVGWLNGQNEEVENEDTYSEFIKDIDTVIMGWNTYHQVVTELSPGQWPYTDLTSYVITHRQGEDSGSEDICFVSERPGALLRRLKEEPGKDIWICGGADVVRQLMEEELIDLFYLSVIPTLLGSGTRLFGSLDFELKLKLVRVYSYNGITEMVYKKR